MTESPKSEMQTRLRDTLTDWRGLEKTALELLLLVGELRFDKSIELIFFRQELYDTRPSQLVDLHATVPKNYTNDVMGIDMSLKITKIIATLDLPPTKIDIGRLALEWLQTKDDENQKPLAAFVPHQLATIIGTKHETKPKDVVLYGFGRIGRMVARRLIELTGRGDQLRLRAIVVRQKMKSVAEELEKRVALLKSDSIHGDFKGCIEIDAEHSEIVLNGNRVKFIFASSPSEIDYTDAAAIQNALVIDNTGLWRDDKALRQHLRPGIAQVLLTAPGKGIPNIVHGVNQKEAEDAEIFCAASCTTNAICPVLKVMHDTFGIAKGHIETVHSYTSDQNLLDNFHPKPRRGRGAPINMVLTTTGAKEAVQLVIPEVGPHLTGNSVRVPCPDGSLAIINLTLKKKTTLEEVQKTLREASLRGGLVEQIGYSTSTEFCSSNLVGTTSACIIDAPSLIVDDEGTGVIVYAWYDNECGYSCQVVRLAKSVSKVRRLHYY
eukprot:TRINITY_DN76896_c0_g1_i1.p1 TRINITY_DN76896_c0_g1~~TRINITY_DN76896_c0_g1_i1.p1  ORF type:complete len:493 (+),score=40.20 TRINITY_DN76896_c0_g1_i1:47-1525(+)